jgi:uncharacterized Fe-S radical SAM superfamily protein PflX
MTDHDKILNNQPHLSEEQKSNVSVTFFASSITECLFCDAGGEKVSKMGSCTEMMPFVA